MSTSGTRLLVRASLLLACGLAHVGCVDITGSLEPTEDPVALGTAEIGEVLEGAVVFENVGEHDVEVRLAGWNDDGDGVFRFQGETQLPVVVFAGDTVSLPVAFTADLPAEYGGELSVSYGQASKEDDLIVATAKVSAEAIGVGADADGDGWTVDHGDCDDEDPDVNPDAEEACNGHDDDCDGEIPEGEVDEDGDGVMVCGGDCDDGDATVYPGADEGCDGIDTDCDGTIEDDLDDDGDGHTVCDGDCDDADAEVYPGAAEVCNGADDDCDGFVPQDEEDTDGDGYAGCDGDCADDDPDVHPGATELCNGHDDDCDGSLDAGEVDADGDGSLACADDCDDSDPDVHPGAPELCNGHDDDCDGAPDGDEVDADGDGLMVCGGDCDDGDATVFLGADEGCNGIDNDCDGLLGQAESDQDGDGYMICEGDCSDYAPATYPGAPELCDGHDNDCDGGVGPDEADADGDGLMACDGDCDDNDAGVHPGAIEVCDGVDNDCDGDLLQACRSCDDVLQAGLSQGDGHYTLDLDGPGGHSPVEVACDMTTDGGGWTAVQQTTDDWGDTGQLVTDYDTFLEQTLGGVTGAFRLAGELWPDLAASGEVLMVAVPRDQGGAPCPGALRYAASGATFDFPPGGPATVSGVQQAVEILSGDTLTTTDTGPAANCLNNDAVPWFLAGCCEACPTYGGTFFSPPSPMVSFLDTEPDLDGRLADDICAAAVDESNGYVGVWTLAFLLR